MNISDKLNKNYWRRRINPDSPIQIPTNVAGYRSTIKGGFGSCYRNLTQEDFLNEISSFAHKINSRYMSTRAIYRPSLTEKDPNGNPKWEIAGYEDVEVVCTGIQQEMAERKASFFAADGFNISNESKNQDAVYDTLLSMRDETGLQVAYLEAIESCFKTGDAAIYLYQTPDNSIEYEVFSFLKGDTLYPGIDDDGNEILYRQYSLQGRPAVDIFSTKYVETWIKVQEKDKDGINLVNKLKRWVKNQAGRERSEDGYVLLSRKENQAGNDMIQTVYFRVDDIPSGPVQQSIESYEKVLSYVSEEVRSFAFSMLFLKSEKVVSLPPVGGNGKTIGVKGNSETVKNSDAKFLTPPDASNLVDIQIKALESNILHNSLSVRIDPEILKSGADSSTTIKIMFAPEIQWCQTRWTQIFPSVKKVTRLFKRLTGKVEKNPTFDSLRCSVWQNIWIPQNESELVKLQTDQVYAKIKSRKAAMQDIGNPHLNDEQQIMKEWEAELELKQRYSGSTTEDNPNIPLIDNNAPGKSLTE